MCDLKELGLEVIEVPDLEDVVDGAINGNAYEIAKYNLILIKQLGSNDEADQILEQIGGT